MFELSKAVIPKVGGNDPIVLGNSSEIKLDVKVFANSIFLPQLSQKQNTKLQLKLCKCSIILVKTVCLVNWSYS